MRITGHSIALPLCLPLPVLVILGCAYRVGFVGLPNVGPETILSWQVDTLPRNVVFGLGVIAALFGVLAHRLMAYVNGYAVRPVTLVTFVLAVLGAVYLATYETVGLIDLYPFAALFVVSMLIFRFETKEVAAILFGVIVVAFFSLGAKEIGERDAEKHVQKAPAAILSMETALIANPIHRS